jgi:hypothetical protein
MRSLPARYRGYLEREGPPAACATSRRSDSDAVDYLAIRTEVSQRSPPDAPGEPGQASRISGVTPSDVRIIDGLPARRDSDQVALNSTGVRRLRALLDQIVTNRNLMGFEFFDVSLRSPCTTLPDMQSRAVSVSSEKTKKILVDDER